MDRRAFLATGATVALLPLTEAPAAAAAARRRANDAKLNALFERHLPGAGAQFARTRHLARPRQGRTPRCKSKLDTGPRRSRAQGDLARNRTRDRAARSDRRRDACREPAKLNREVVLYSLETEHRRRRRVRTSIRAQRPYPIFQQGGAYFATPDFLNTSHTIDNAADAEAYLSRLAQFATMLDNDTAEQRAQAARGFLAPAGRSIWRSARCASCATSRREQTARWSNSHRQPRRGQEHRRRLAARARRSSSPKPSIPRSTARSRRWSSCGRPRRPGDGAWRLPERRRDLCRGAASRRRPPTSRPTRSTRSASARSPRSAPSSTRSSRRQGYTQGSVGERLAALNKRARPALSRTPTPGRAELIASLNAGVKDMYARAAAGVRDPAQRSRSRSAAFRPKSRTARRTAITAARRSMARGPAIYFINLKDTRRLAEVYAAVADLSRGRPGPSPADQHRAGVEGHPDAAQARLLLGLLAKAGRSMPSSSPTSSASMRRSARTRRLPAVVPVPRRAAGRRHRHPHQALEPRAGDRLHGADDRLRRARARSARSSATARRSARPAATRSATPPGFAPAPKPRRRSATEVRHQAVPRDPARRRNAAVDPGAPHPRTGGSNRLMHRRRLDNGRRLAQPPGFPLGGLLCA